MKYLVENLSELIEICGAFIIGGAVLAIAGWFCGDGWLGEGLWMIGNTIMGSTMGVFTYWFVVELREARQKRRLAAQLTKARQARGLTYEQVFMLTHIDVARLELAPESLYYFPGRLTGIVKELSDLYGQPIVVNSLIA